MSEFELPIVLILKFEALGQLGRADDAEIALDPALAISPTNFDFHVRTRRPGSALRSMPTWWKAYARQDWEKRSSTPYGLLSRLLLMAHSGHADDAR